MRAEIAQKNPTLSLPRIRLLPAPVNIKGVTFQISDGHQLQDVKTVTCSNYPPFTALVNLMLEPGSTARVASALRGETEMMAVRYELQLPVASHMEVALCGDVQAELAQLGPAATQEECRQVIQAALDGGQLTVQWSAPGNVQDEAHTKVLKTAVDRAATFLLSLVAGVSLPTASTNLEVTADGTFEQTLNFTSVADVGTWFSSEPGGTNIRLT